METPSEKLREAWNAQAASVARKINLGWWIQAASAPLVIAGLAGACTLLLVRRELPDTPTWALATATAAAVLLPAAISWAVIRRRFETVDQSLVRIEAAMRLRSGLSAAKAGVAAWPELPQKVSAGVDWHWQRVLVPPLAAIAFLTAGFFLPVSARTQQGAGGHDQPLAWESLESDLERLDQEEVIDETYIEEMRKKLEELRSQEEEDWFSHSSLEATDNLAKEHASEVQKMARELERADRALSQLEKNGGAMAQGEKDRLMQQFDQAMQGLQNGALKPNPELLEQLKQLDPGNLGQLSPDQMKQLRESMKKAGQACKDCQGGGQGGDDWTDELLNEGDGQGEGQGQNEGDGEPGNKPGKGEVQRGPGHSPGMLGDEGKKIDIGDVTGLESKDLSRALPGDLLQVQDGEHQIDRTDAAIRAGGDTSATGTGGDRVWKDSLNPDEQRALKKFFE